MKWFKMKTAVTTRTKKPRSVIEVVDVERKSAKSLSLEEIENRMVELATSETTDIVQNMINEKKLEMLEKVANFKFKRLQMEQLENANKQIEMQPITVEFIDSNTVEQAERLKRIDAEITQGKKVGEDA